MSTDQECICDCEKEDLLDLSTDEGQKAYLLDLKEKYKRQYQSQVRSNQREDLERKLKEQARLEVIQELGLSEEEFDNVTHSPHLLHSRNSAYAHLEESDLEAIRERVRQIQERQNHIINLMLCLTTHVDAEKKGIRNAFVTEYLDLEQSKATQLDILSSAYLTSNGPMKIVNARGLKFSTGGEN